MKLSRRTFLASTAATALAGAVPQAASAASPPGDVVGKVTVGYQGWFACGGDGAPINGWWHWSNNWGQPPSPTNTAIVSWPDVRDYSSTYQTAYPNLGNGQAARLFSSYDQQTVNTHFQWMQQNGCDTAALQRFNPTGGEEPTRAAGSGIRALDEDGTACTSDYYLRLTNDGGRMFKGQAPVTATRPTQPWPA
ncbi:hypothetical protein [Kribbella sp. NPDC049227]|uniref:hypothetical protein n=1 Tax=Kribbella sp. NPDC049227 TaxID=3364113 RepID=UPI003712E8F8